MKKLVSFLLLLALILSLSACGKAEVTMQEIYDAGSVDAMLEGHESVHVLYSLDGVVYDENYRSKEYVMGIMRAEYYSQFSLESDIIGFVTEDACYNYYDGSYERELYLSPEGWSDMEEIRELYSLAQIMSPDTVDEIIQSVTKTGDRITVKTVLPPEYVAVHAEENVGLNSVDCEYVLDAKTHELFSVLTIMGYEDGTVYENLIEIIYDGETPEEMQAFLEFESQTEELYTLTVVMNPGSENEKNCSIQLPKGLPVGVYSSTEKEFSAYADAACTEPFVSSGDHTEDVTIYMKWAE